MREWLSLRDAVDPTADDAEQLLAAWCIVERLARLEARPGNPSALGSPGPEVRSPPPPRVARGLQLILEGTYPEVLPEAMQWLEEKQWYVPPALLPALLARAAALAESQADFADVLLQAGGARAAWLCGINPAWEQLAAGFPYPSAWERAVTPAQRASLLLRWRRRDAVAARMALAGIWDGQSPKNQESLVRTLAVGLSAADHPWLRAQLAAPRKGVRREILQLLAQSEEAQAIDDLLTLASFAVAEDGRLREVATDPAAQEVLARYGGLRDRESLAALLLSTLPPRLLPDLMGKSPAAFWATLNPAQLKIVAMSLLRGGTDEEREDFLRFAVGIDTARLPLEQTVSLAQTLSAERFEKLVHDWLDQEKNVLAFGALPRLLLLARTTPWSERISKAFVLQLVSALRDARDLPPQLQKDLLAHWHLAAPLLHTASFPWLRTQLHAITERADGFGKAATRTLQLVGFRAAMREG